MGNFSPTAAHSVRPGACSAQRSPCVRNPYLLCAEGLQIRLAGFDSRSRLHL